MHPSFLQIQFLTRHNSQKGLKCTNECFEYFCRMSSKSIVIISSYTVSKLVRFLRYRYSVDVATTETGQRSIVPLRYEEQSICSLLNNMYNTIYCAVYIYCDNDQFCAPCIHYGDRCFAAAGLKLWNSLPADLRQADISFQQFKRLLKTFLFGCWDRGTLRLTVEAVPHKFPYLLTLMTISSVPPCGRERLHSIVIESERERERWVRPSSASSVVVLRWGSVRRRAVVQRSSRCVPRLRPTLPAASQPPVKTQHTQTDTYRGIQTDRQTVTQTDIYSDTQRRHKYTLCLKKTSKIIFVITTSNFNQIWQFLAQKWQIV